MTRGTKKFLKDLRYIFKQGSNQTTEEIWNILTALRGPDTQNIETKEATTAVIRHAVFGYGSKVENNATVLKDSSLGPSKRARLKDNHFRSHAFRAFDALGLKWGETNE